MFLTAFKLKHEQKRWRTQRDFYNKVKNDCKQKEVKESGNKEKEKQTCVRARLCMCMWIEWMRER